MKISSQEKTNEFKKLRINISNIKLYSTAIIYLSLAGLVSSIYLLVTHYRNYTDVEFRSFCAFSKSFNCDTVAQSHYSIFLNIPVAIWGIVGYLFFFFFSIICSRRTTTFFGTTFLFFLSCIFSLTSLALALITILKISSYCIVCIFTYGINFSLLLLTWMAHNRLGQGSFQKTLIQDFEFLRNKRKKIAVLFATVITILIACILFYPRYWLFPTLTDNTNLEQGITEDGSPWIGAQNPSITITEYADYLCFQCGKMHHHLRQLINRYPDQIRLIHRHFPLDNKVNPLIKDDVHPNSGLLSFVAIMAQEQNLFWQVNDLLFREGRVNQSINFGMIAERTGLNISQLQQKLNDQKLHQKLAEDIRSGLQLNITATPSYVIDGKVYSGTIPMDILETALKNSR